jgi:hypothetical protein
MGPQAPDVPWDGGTAEYSETDSVGRMSDEAGTKKSGDGKEAVVGVGMRTEQSTDASMGSRSGGMPDLERDCDGAAWG